MADDTMTWDLTQIVQGASVQEIQEVLQSRIDEFEAFSEKYFKDIDTMSPSEINTLLQEYERFYIQLTDLCQYCKLRFDANSMDKEAAQMHQWSEQTRSKFDQLSAPMKIVLGKRIFENPTLLESPELSRYVHFLEKMAAWTPFRLSEKVEKLVKAKDLHGIYLVSQLRRSWVSEKSFEVEIENERKTLPYTSLGALRVSPDREVRKTASSILYKSFHDDKLLHAYALRSICADHISMTRLRNMPSPMTQSFLDQDVDSKTIESLLNAIENTANRYQEFLKLKAKIMGLDRLAGYDVIAPITRESSWSFSWAEAKSIAIESYSSFDHEFGSIVEDMFRGRRVDAENRLGKRSGAFCAPWYAKKKSFVHTTYNDTLSELLLLSHELGHAVQSYYAFRDQSALSRSPGACLSEMGSIFGELLITEKILHLSESKEQKIEILGELLSRYFYMVYYVGFRALFEKSLYEAIENGRLIDAETACDLWRKARQRIFGDSVDWDEAEYMEYEWARIPHFFMANYRFYNYSYSFAQMLVFALYEAYNEGGDDFTKRFKRLLGMGGSMSPHDQLMEFGYDIADPKFWELGAVQADSFLRKLRELL